jgi:hypothetical protein
VHVEVIDVSEAGIRVTQVSLNALTSLAAAAAAAAAAPKREII